MKFAADYSTGNKYPILYILAICFSFCSVLQIVHMTIRSPGYDFYNFWIYGQEFKESTISNFYSNEFDSVVAKKYFQKAMKEEDDSKIKKAASWSSKIYEEGHVSAATPFFYAALSILISNDYDSDLAIFQVLSTLLFFLMIYVLGRYLRNVIPVVLLMISFICLFYTPFRHDIEVANLARIQTGLFVGSLLILGIFNNRFGFLLCGLILGLSIALKPNGIGIPIVLTIVWFFKRNFNKIIFVTSGICLGSLIGITYSSIYFGSMDCWAHWGQAVLTLQKDPLPGGFRNVSLSLLITRHVGIDVSSFILVGLTLSVILSCYYATKKRNDDYPNLTAKGVIEDLWGMGAGLLLIFMSFNVIWDHYLLLLTPVIITLISPIGTHIQCINDKYEMRLNMIGGLILFIYALLPLRLLFPTASPDILLGIFGLSSILFWILLLYGIYIGINKPT